MTERLLFAEPFLAWRAWRVVMVDEEPRLQSVVWDSMWLPREHMKAECVRLRGEAEPGHESPDESCKCGIYGSTDIDHLRSYVHETKKNHPHAPPVPVPSENRVFGLVALWGTVIECSAGFRAGMAYPSHLYLPCLTHGHAGGLEAYGVPVTCVDEAHGFEALRQVVRKVRAQESDGGSPV